jgi:hypothetical protein
VAEESVSEVVVRCLRGGMRGWVRDGVRVVRGLGVVRVVVIVVQVRDAVIAMEVNGVRGWRVEV